MKVTNKPIAVMNLFCIPVFAVTIIFSMTSCGEGAEEPAKSSEERTLIPGHHESYPAEQGSAPAIIRSGLPENYYGYTTDTAQVSQYIRRIFEDSKGNLWLGTVGDGACYYNGTSLTYYTTAEGLSGNNIQGIAEDSDGNTWFGTTGGVSRFDGTRFINFTTANGLGADHILSLFIDRQETVWVGTAEGIFRYNANASDSSSLFTLFPFPGTGEPEVNCIVQDEHDNLWFATNGDGVYRYNGKSLSHLSMKDGLADNSINWIEEDSSGMLWMTTVHNGVSRYNPSKKTFTNYTTEDGLDFNFATVVLQDRLGRVWISGKNSICHYLPDAAESKDVKHFAVFNSANGLKNTGAQSICEDHSGNLWFGTGDGLFLFDGAQFVNIPKQGPWPVHGK